MKFSAEFFNLFDAHQNALQNAVPSAFKNVI